MNTEQAELLRDPTRMRILDAASAPSTAAEIADHMDVPVTRIYGHIDKLVSAGLMTVTETRKQGAAVSRVYAAAASEVSREGSASDVASMLADAQRDADASGPDDQRIAGRVVTRMTPSQAAELVAAVETMAAETAQRPEPDEGSMVSLTFVVAPLAGPRSSPISIRPLTDDDLPAVQQTVYTAIGWNPEEQIPPLDAIVDHPEFARYHVDWGRSGDFGVAAVTGDEIVGAAFGRLFTDEDHGHGYIDEETPELAIGIWGAQRGKGLGTRWVNAFHDQARAHGMRRVSLSVAKDNPAVALYARSGYRFHSADGNSVRMVIDLEPASPTRS